MFIHLGTEFIANELPPAWLVDAEGEPLELTDEAMVGAGWYRFTIEPEPGIAAGQRLTYTRPTSGADCIQVWVVEPLPEQEVAALRSANAERKWQAIKAERDIRKSGGFFTGSQWFHSDEASRGQYGILLTTALEKALPADYVLDPAWKDMSGGFSEMTVAKVRLIRDVGLLLERNLFTAAEAHRAAMEASPAPLEYDFSTGWPAHYEGAL